MHKSVIIAAWAALITRTVSQNCILLAGSTACPAFESASISTNSFLTGLYPFLESVTNVQEFDTQLSNYVEQGYVQSKYVSLFGCTNINLSNTTAYYARYTTSFLCNGVIQNSRQPCNLADTNSRPLCADSCAELARSEETIISSTELCSPRNSNYADQLRADFTNCALPADSLGGQCISGVQNEPNDCGFGGNLMGLCNYCRASTTNATDSCCFTSNTQDRCQNVVLPVFSSVADVFSSTSTASSSSPTRTSAATNSGGHGLSGGAIAGIVIGSILGFLLLLALLILAIRFCMRKRREQNRGAFLNQPSPQRKGMTTASYPPTSSSQQGYEVLPGGRVARMTALSGDGPSNTGGPGQDYDPYGDSPGSNGKMAGIIGSKTHRSPGSDENNNSSNEYSSPEGVGSGQSEQLPFFKDYYSNDDIHPGDKVSVLWAYQPRAGDEFELERGDMLKVIGIWDDGWATGVRISDRAEDYEGKHKAQRDSGVSNGTANREDTPPPPGEIKAFPLVCVCLPEAWKKTVEGDSSTEGSGPPPI